MIPAVALGAPPAASVPLGEALPVWAIAPFAGMLLSIALLPLLSPHFWRHHYPKVALAWGLAFAVPFLAAHGGGARHEFLHVALVDYVPFITLLWALFTVSGGIVVRGTPRATPAVNTALLAVGTVAASWIGTTGAAMLLVRPLLRANAGRRRASHVVVFFIFLVANVGGVLTPLGDPPLFLGFLHGIPFFWTLHLAPHFLFVATLLLAAFYCIDRHRMRRDPGAVETPEEAAPQKVRVRVAGARNLVFAAGIVAGVLLSGLWKSPSLSVLGVRLEWSDLAREALIAAMGLLSLATTPRALRAENGFSWEPIREVAILFAGIFATIIPAIAILKAGEHGALGFLVERIREPWQFFWATGLLSSVLDNAPTYLTFLNVGLGRLYPGLPEASQIARILAEHPQVVEAVSAGAVFMGANTYIGNAPNFMVKSISEEAGMAMPSFFGYLFRWALPILVPVFLLAGWIFF